MCKILPNFFHISKSLTVCIPPSRLLFAFLCTFLRNAIQLFAFLCAFLTSAVQLFPFLLSTFFHKSFPQYRNGSNGFPTDRIWRFGITLRIFRERRPAVIFTIGKVVHNGQLGLVWLIHWNWDRFLECHIFPNHCDIFKDFPVLPGQKENLRKKYGKKKQKVEFFDKHYKGKCWKEVFESPCRQYLIKTWHLRLCMLTFEHLISQIRRSL